MSQLQISLIFLNISMQPKAQTFLINAELKKLAAKTNITCPDKNDPNTIWEELKTRITCAHESAIKEREHVTPC